jgi:hypothetical protein
LGEDLFGNPVLLHSLQVTWPTHLLLLPEASKFQHHIKLHFKRSILLVPSSVSIQFC